MKFIAFPSLPDYLESVLALVTHISMVLIMYHACQQAPEATAFRSRPFVEVSCSFSRQSNKLVVAMLCSKSSAPRPRPSLAESMSAKLSSIMLLKEFSMASCLRAFFLEDFPDGVVLVTRPLETTTE